MIEVRLLKILEDQKRTRYWLAKRTRMTYAAITNICNGMTHGIDYTSLDAICRELKCQPGDVLVRIADENEAESVE